MKRSEWRWREGDGASLGMKYIPGNPGDVFKAWWAFAIAEALGDGPIVYGDVFAGWPRYPLTAETRALLAGTPLTAEDHWPSTAALVAQRRGALERRVFDAGEGRRDAWADEDVRWIDTDDGWAAVGEPHAALLGCDWVVVDPYDLDRPEHFGRALPGLAALARRTHLLVYYYNRAPGGSTRFREYRAQRRKLAEALAREPAVVGRVPVDAILPRTWHELWWIPAENPRVPVAEGLEDQLADAARSLAVRLARDGAVERAQ